MLNDMIDDHIVELPTDLYEKLILVGIGEVGDSDERFRIEFSKRFEGVFSTLAIDVKSFAAAGDDGGLVERSDLDARAAKVAVAASAVRECGRLGELMPSKDAAMNFMEKLRSSHLRALYHKIF